MATGNVQGQYELKWPDRLCMFKTQRSAYNITFLVYQEELGAGDEENDMPGKHHIQGYLELDKDIEFKSLKAAFSKRIHWEKRFGTAEQAEDYASKEETRVLDGLSGKFGERSSVKQGQRTDLEAATKIINDPAIKNKKRKLAEECGAAVVKYHKGLETYAMWKGVSLDESRGNQHRQCYIIWGDAGCGKSLMAKRLIGDDSFYQPQSNNGGALSFESYRGEQWILLEDYKPGTISLDALKRLMDRYECALPARGSGSSPVGMHKGVIITSQHQPREFVGDEQTNPQHLVALKRRCQQIISVKESGWHFENPQTGVCRVLPPQMPKLEAWARSRGIWQDQAEEKAAIELFWEEEQAQADIAQTQEVNWFDADPVPSSSSSSAAAAKSVVDLTQDSDAED